MFKKVVGTGHASLTYPWLGRAKVVLWNIAVICLGPATPSGPHNCNDVFVTWADQKNITDQCATSLRRSALHTRASYDKYKRATAAAH
jgi:hypothetical protein